ncbi:helix-hairpin-helix domain-containing protein [bacterium]|nr:helix-hairpin-helix domain-containing protein [bacterium]
MEVLDSGKIVLYQPGAQCAAGNDGGIVVAHGVQIYRAGSLPFDDAYYAETDSLFRLLSARADSLDAVDTLYQTIDFNGLATQRIESRLTQNMGLNGKPVEASPLEPLIAEISRWIVRDTLEKPVVSFPINIGTATEKELQALPRIGPQMAKRIVTYRDKTPFRSIEDLLLIRGIGPKTMDRLRDLVTLQDSLGAEQLKSGLKILSPLDTLYADPDG